MSESILERLTLLEPDWADVVRRSGSLRRRQLLRQTLLAAVIVVGVVALAGGAYAAAREIWSGHDMTPAEIDAQATTVYNDKWSVCDPFPHCKNETGTHTQVLILPSMGVVFVLPDGDTTSLVPGSGFLSIPAAGLPGTNGHLPADDAGHVYGTVDLTQDSVGDTVRGEWTVPLPDGGRRTITWTPATGSVTVADTVGGVTTTTALTAGDVVPLIPGTLVGDPRTLDKAVTFDLPTGNEVIIFPRLNETYIDSVENALHEAEPLGKGVAVQYGLTPVGEYNGKLPVTPSGGTWTAYLPGGLTRTISWHAGDSFVTVKDTTAAGTTTTQVPIGHELPLVPFK